MKTAKYRVMIFAAVVAALASQRVLAADDPETSWRDQPGSSHQEWRFDTGSNPLTAEVCLDGPPHTATMAPGPFALGWQSQLPSLGDASGIWDLGSRGTISAPLPSFVTAPEPSIRYILVSVCQYQDGSIYSELATVAVPGATYVRTGVDFTTFGALGEWTVDQTLWRVDAGASAGPVSITAAGNGSVVDKVILEAGTPASQPALLKIRSLGGSAVEISWAASLQGFVLESNTDLNDPQGWQPVDAQVQVSGDQQFVQLAGGDSARFFRLRKP
jgi:hypothetical protein